VTAAGAISVVGAVVFAGEAFGDAFAEAESSPEGAAGAGAGLVATAGPAA
jgi:hypothetical protein